MLNLVEILKDCPEGTELWCPLFGPVTFIKINDSSLPISVKYRNEIKTFDKYGRYFSQYEEGKCVLFPSEKCFTWEGWKAPKNPKFKINDWVAHNNAKSAITPKQIVDINDAYILGFEPRNLVVSIDTLENHWHLWSIEDAKEGDVLICESGWTCIFKKLNGDTFDSYCFMSACGDTVYDGGCCHTLDPRINGKLTPATAKQCRAFFSKIRNFGYEWNSYRKELKLLATPKFNIEDWVVSNNTRLIYKILDFSTPNELGKLDYKVEIYLDGIYQTTCFISTDKMDNWGRLWTITDAEDGDVLITTQIRSCPFIYRKTNSKNNLTYYYVGIDGNGNLSQAYPKNTLCHFGPTLDVVPATKEQRELLFAKIEESGYQWDKDQKKLKKFKSHYDIANFKPFDKVLGRNCCRSGVWRADYFSHIHKNGKLFVGIGYTWEQCIPFNDDTKHLLGTTDMCDEQYINW